MPKITVHRSKLMMNQLSKLETTKIILTDWGLKSATKGERRSRTWNKDVRAES